jgi:hypothetical protein
MDLLSHCRLSTGLPFGSLLAALVLGIVILGGALAWWRLRLRAAGRVAGIVALLAAARLGLAGAAEAFVPVELNPFVQRASLIGTWTDGPARLELREDGSYSLADGRDDRGAWTRTDWNLNLGGSRWRVIQARGEERIVPDWPDDPDRWDGDLGFRRALP